MPVMRCRVVCALEVMIDIRSPTRSFIRVDLPTLGLPTMFTNPALCPSAVISAAAAVSSSAPFVKGWK